MLWTMCVTLRTYIFEIVYSRSILMQVISVLNWFITIVYFYSCKLDRNKWIIQIYFYGDQIMMFLTISSLIFVKFIIQHQSIERSKTCIVCKHRTANKLHLFPLTYHIKIALVYCVLVEYERGHYGILNVLHSFF